MVKVLDTIYQAKVKLGMSIKQIRVCDHCGKELMVPGLNFHLKNDFCSAACLIEYLQDVLILSYNPSFKTFVEELEALMPYFGSESPWTDGLREKVEQIKEALA